MVVCLQQRESLLRSRKNILEKVIFWMDIEDNELRL